jgi:uncharacterized protein involved in outer membrane biogenesis
MFFAMKFTSRFRRWLAVVVALLALFTLAGFFVLPPILKSQLERRLSAATGRRVTVEKVRLNPYALSLSLENFAVCEADGARPFLGWRRLYVNFEALASFGDAWVLGEITLDGFDAHVTVNPDQTLNFSDVLAKLAPPSTAPTPVTPAQKVRPVRIRSLNVTDAKVLFADRSRQEPFTTTLGPLTFAVTEFRTVSERGAPYRFEAITEAGEKLAWSGTLQAEPLRSSGELSLENILLPKYAPYYADRLRADLVGGTLSVRGHYDFSLAEQRVMTLRDGALQLRGFKLVERANPTVALELPVLDVTGVNANALASQATIAAIRLSGGKVRARREKDGSINLLAMLQPPAPTPVATPAPAATPVAATPAPGKLPDVKIAAIAVSDLAIEVTDLAAPRPAQLALSELQLALKNVTLAEGAEMPLQLAFAWAPHGRVRLDGSVVRAPLKIKFKTEVEALELLPLSPYLEQFVNARLTGGAINASLAIDAALPEAQPLAATIAGEVNVEKLGLVDGTHNEELAGFAALAFRGIRATTSPELSVALDEIALNGPLARVIVDRDGVLNLATLARTSAPAPATSSGAAVPASESARVAATTPSASAALPKIEIGKITIAEGDYRFVDRSIEPNTSMAIAQFGGTIAGLSSSNPAKADVALKAMVDGAGPVAITGKLDPLGPKTALDLKVDLRNVDLVPLSPYCGKYAGYELARGKLALDVKMLVDGRKIDATNVLTLHQFTFGGPVQSAEATKLPVRLGVALLKDIDGKIVIDVPIQGSTDDPNFRIGRVVLRVITNLLTKVAVSPFALLGSAFGGGGDELGYQEFAPGAAELQEAERKKLETVMKALTQRPGLSLDFEGSYDPAADAYALKRAKLAERIRLAVWEAKHLADPNIPPPAQLVIAPEEIAAITKKLYDEQFPPGTKFGAPLPPPPAVAAPPPAPPSWFQRVVRTITWRTQREQRAVEQENKRRLAEHEQAVAAAVATGIPLEEMTGRLAEAVTVDDNDLRALAQRRAQQVRDYFANVGKISADRLFLTKSRGETAAQGKGPRVFLHLQ